jgi:hypothetical protein
MRESEKKVYNDRVEYFKNGKRHRDDGPAIEFKDGYIEYWENGEFIKGCLRRYSNPPPLKYRYSRRDICGWMDVTEAEIIARLSKFHTPDYAEKFIRSLNARPGVEISTGIATYKAEKEVAK